MIKLFNDDCLEILPTLSENSVDGIITDPPYGMNYQSNRVRKYKQKEKIANDTKPFIKFLEPSFNLLKNDSFAIIFCRWDSWNAFQTEAERVGFICKEQIVWDKGNHGTGDLTGSPGSRHEIAMFLVKGQYKLPGDRPQTLKLVKKLAPSKMRHPNEKPIQLMEWLVNGYTKVQDTILDPFMGVTPVGVACAIHNRNYVGIELEKKYFDISKSSIDKAISPLIVL